MGGVARARAACRTAGVLLGALLGGCDARDALGGAPACAPDAFEPLAPPVLLAERTLVSGASSDPIRLDEAGFVEVLMRPDDACVQVVEAIDGLGRQRIALDGPDVFCRTCPDRTAMLVGSGLFLLPSDAQPLAAPLEMRLGLRSCSTLGPPRASDGPVTTRVSFRPLVERATDGSSRGVLRIDVAFVNAILPEGVGGSDVAARLAQEVEAFLDDARLRVDVHTLCVANDVSLENELVVQAGDVRGPRELVERLRSVCPGLTPKLDDPRLAVVYVPCLRFVDSLVNARASLDGYTTHVPGGVSTDGVGDVILLGDGCELRRGEDAGLPRGLARDLAHEIGHYLGLFHSVEADGETTDTLADTNGDDLMNAQPSLATARGLSPSQVAIVRAHPVVRWPRAGHEACADPR